MYTCTTCNQSCEALHKHHIVPKALGGLDIPGNIVAICESCHSKIHNKKFLNHSELTKAGLAKAKARGVKLGGYREGHTAHHEATVAKANKKALEVGEIICSMRDENKTFAAIAEELTRREIPTSLGGAWHATTVRNYYKRFLKLLEKQKENCKDA